MSGGEMADEDRSAAPGDRWDHDDSSSDWFFRDADVPAEDGAGDENRPTQEPGHRDDDLPAEFQQSRYYGPFGSPPPDEPTQVLPAVDDVYGAEVREEGYRLNDGYDAPHPFAGPPGVGAMPTSYPTPSYVTAGAVGSAGGAPAGGSGSGGFAPPPASAAPVPAGRRPARRPRGGLILLLAALLAALVGTAAGYGGARWAQSSPSVTTPTLPAGGPTSAGAPRATPLPAGSGQMDTVAVAAAALPSTVMIRAGSGDAGGTGSGFVLDDDGHIMTNNHVIAGAADGGQIVVVFSDGARLDADLVGRSPSYDLAVIKINGDHELVPMPIGDSERATVGEAVVAIGSPLALASTVTQGIVSAKNRPVVVSSDGGADSPTAYINGIQTDAAINPGNSGGPLVDASARVIGVNSAILTLGQSRDTSGNIGLGFAIPINQASEIGRELIADGKATYPIIGVNVGNDNDDGVRLSQVDANGPAETAGLQVDDVVTAIDGQPVTTAEELIVAIRTHRPGDTVTLTYRRGGSQGSADVTLGSREG